MTPVRHVVVAVPARDEELVLDRCLGAIGRAVLDLGRRRPGVTVEVVVALDRCRDGSALVAAAHPVRVVALDAGAVGVARHRAIVAGRRGALAVGAGPAATWLALTDADTEVPAHWLTEQLRLADAGHDLVVGTVEPRPAPVPGLVAAWRARHVLAEGHPHVHGANLGVRADAYEEAGGFPPWRTHEDVELVRRVRASGRPWVATDRTRVRTSARLVGRAPGGFAAHLAALVTTTGTDVEPA
ncbi:glycosyltransferase [Arthrobacter sp. NEB 688]|uniref:glycosyltransferase n=1 Tax=Arthrobacter sp. NEB 688 TaxID=904039 RepID=UPI0015640B79|nr:glycosyltransferase [Arthrobacter sp. NEB 688]QKE82862.1 glycosyltransferase [Arthrobacter sp. NEB 688]